MDPATGRRFIRAARFLSDLYIHKMPVPAADWREYAGSPDFLDPLRSRLTNLGIDAAADQLLTSATNDSSWKTIAALDAGVRMVESIVNSGAVASGPQATRVLESFLAKPDTIPDHYWSARPASEPD